MIKILVVSPMSKDANSFHRCMGPLGYLEKYVHKGERYQIKLANDEIGNPQPHGMSGIAWDSVGRFDLVYMHRPCRPDDMIVLKVARNMNVPVIIDYDDWLFDVPNWNPVAPQYNNVGVHNMVASLMALADVVTVSTSALYDRVKLVNKNCIIVPNCYRSDLYRYRKTKHELPPRNPTVAWRGTNTHEGDVLSVVSGWRKSPHKNLFFGNPPFSLLSQLPTNSFQMAGASDPFLYMQNIYKAAPKATVVPLVDCFFNRVKSNIGYQESLHAGAICIAPELPEWVRPGVVTYKPGDGEGFLEALEGVMAMHPDDHAETVDVGYKEMLKLYDTSVVSPIRERIIESVVDLEFERNTRDPWDPLTGIWALSKLKGRPDEIAHVPSETLKEKGLA